MLLPSLETKRGCKCEGLVSVSRENTYFQCDIECLSVCCATAWSGDAVRIMMIVMNDMTTLMAHQGRDITEMSSLADMVIIVSPVSREVITGIKDTPKCLLIFPNLAIEKSFSE